MRKRVYFEKKDEMKYLSNLDFARFLERLFKINKIKLKYTNGFSPRPKLSFGNPISIGEEACFEPFDVDILDNLENDFIIDTLNKTSPKGFKVLKIEDIESKGSIINDFNGIEYKIYFEELEEKNKFLALIIQDEIIEEKEKKGKIKKRNLKDKILFFKEENDGILIVLENISPNAYFRLVEIDVNKIMIKRLRYVNI